MQSWIDAGEMSPRTSQRLYILGELPRGHYTNYENRQDKSIQNELRSSQATRHNGIPTNEAMIVTLDCKTGPIVRQNTRNISWRNVLLFSVIRRMAIGEDLLSADQPIANQ